MTERSWLQFIAVVAVVVTSAVGTARGQAPGAGSSAPTISAVDPIAAVQDLRLAGEIVPFFDRGYFVSRIRDTFDKSTVNVVLVDEDGVQVRQARIWVPGATRVRLIGAVAAASGAVVATGYAVMSDGGAEHFIAETDLGGTVTATIRTNPFVPTCICAASDGTVWALGRELGKDERHEDFTMLRHFSFATGLLGEYLPRSSFQTAIDPAAVATTSSVGGFQATYLRCAGNRADLYVNVSNEFIQVDPSTNDVRRWPVAISKVGDAVPSGFAVTSAGRVFTSLRTVPGVQPALSGIYELEAGDADATAHFVPVGGMAGVSAARNALRGAAAGQLWGADGENLVIREPGETRLVRADLTARQVTPQ
jgi:hypothetical protein